VLIKNIGRQEGFPDIVDCE